MKKILSLLAAGLCLSSCASIDKLTSNIQKPSVSSAINDRSEYISTAIADWVSEEAQAAGAQNVEFSTSMPSNANDIIGTSVLSKLQTNGLKIAITSDTTNMKVWYLVSEIDDHILIRIRADNREATRLFTKGENNSIVPASPLTIRANP
jgi:uncharacterized protein YceK